MLERIKKYFDIKSETLAAYADCSVSLINSILTGRRAVSLAIEKTFLKLETALEMAVPVEELSHAQAFSQQQEAKNEAALQSRIRKMERLIVKKQNTIEQLNGKREIWLRGWHACRTLQENITTEPKTLKWAYLREAHLTTQLEAHLANELDLIGCEIVGLKAELEALKAL